jgi:hypothetical protein
MVPIIFEKLNKKIADPRVGHIMAYMTKLVDIEKLSELTGFPVSTLRTFVRARKIPFFKYGYRTMRFDPAKAEKALQRFEIPAVDAK